MMASGSSGMGIAGQGEGRGTERRYLWLLLVFGLIVYFVGNGALAVTDPVESNYTETAKEMLFSGDYFSPRIYGAYWYDKPIIIYWELIAAYQLFGVTDFAARFFPALFACALIFLTYFFGKRLYGARLGFVAALLIGTTVELWYVGHAVITDTTFVAALSGALFAFFVGYQEQRPRYYYLAFFLCALATLTKGPIGLCLPGLVILLFLAWERRLKELLTVHLIGGLALFVAVAAIWYWPMYQLHGQDFIESFFGVHNVLRAQVSEHPRNDVWFFYILIYFAGLLPWSLASLPAIVKRLWRRDVRLPQTSEMRFLVVWTVAVVGVFQCFATKYVTYTMPYLVPVSILLARYFAPRERLFRALGGGMAVLLVLLALFAAPPMMRQNSGKDAAAALAPLSQQIAQESGQAPTLVFYSTWYSTSFVYYSGLVPYRLEPLAIALTEMPGAGKGEARWGDRNVMPFMLHQNLPLGNDILLMSRERRRDEKAVTAELLQEDLGGAWESLGQAGGYLLFRHRRDESLPRISPEEVQRTATQGIEEARAATPQS